MHQKFNNRLGKNKIKTSAISISEVPFGIFCHLVLIAYAFEWMISCGLNKCMIYKLYMN